MSKTISGIEQLENKQRAYKACFGTPDGETVLKDLELVCFERQSTVPPDGDPIKMARNEGMRAVLVHIKRFVDAKPDDLQRLAEALNKRGQGSPLP